ncbi:peptide-methionine (S)-S-oxide reductase MsrA [Candidimonas nitroreducens]|uniref:Peptide methionine sulfoxide reductase MsrA n=1 Tax=Candidimonas nitroreducens TaxID=683354 RepID=A0A225M0L8_9BURK|nr:peptide-methionine (S)-S-oxide reductase MsrA [Candidimonas nitroreducens]OWT54262.1 peptide-methionine (S)-S-oxide reductase [Candidimonas nitroreducens]
MSNEGTAETIVLGGGCFWCTESVFSAVRGVISVTPGYCGGHVENPSYQQVCEQNTGHIEVVEVRFDPAVVSLETLLQIFFATHDPTTPDRQGADVGPQYASAIFCQSPQQEEVARRVMAQVQAELGTPVVTHLLPAQRFWPAEQYHRDYYAQHPEQGYCRMVISPKMAKFRKHYAELLA